MAPAVSVGSQLAGYRIDELVGRGGMGLVYRATQLTLDRPVALKVVAPEFAEDEDFRERFKRESRLAAQIDHSHVVPIYEAGEADGVLFISMRYVEGTDLKAVIASEGRLPPRRAAELVAQVGSALDAAHERGLIHRDVKPANVLIADGSDGEQVYLTDFGLTKDTGSQSGLTRTGHWVGTLDYVAPEQIQGEAIDARADVYALGCVLYEALTGQLPYPKETDVSKMWAHVSEPPPRVSRAAPDVPRAFDEIVRRALDKNPEQRHPSAGDLGRAALAALEGEVVAGPERSVARGAAAPPAPAGATVAESVQEPVADAGEAEVRDDYSRGGTVTFLFTDLVSSTEILDQLGDDAAEELRRTHFRLLREGVPSGRGKEVKNLGDGLMVAFPSALDAVEAAIAMQRAVHRHNRRHGDRAMSVRIGLSAGEPIRDEEDYFGTPVVVAKRLCDKAEGGQILASELVRGLIGRRGEHEFRGVGELALKGLAESTPCYEVAWQATGEHRIPLPSSLADREPGVFVGRESDRETLLGHWKEAMGGRRQLLFVAGEPGIGKTRLVTELCLQVFGDNGDSGATVLFGRSYEETLVPYQPFIGALRHYVSSAAPDALREQVAESGVELTTLLPEINQRAPDLPEPVGGDQEGERYRLFEAVSAFLARIAEECPLLLVLDDLHWADKPTLLLLKHVARASEQAPLMIVGTYRETDLVRTHPLAEALADLRGEGLLERVSLKGLGEDEVRALIEGWAGHDAPPEFVEAVHDETEGNPFFIEEVLRHLAESGAIYQREGRWTTDLSIEDIGIPEGVKEVIGRRLSRLGEPANRALGVASVVGRTFGLSLLERVSDLSGDELLDGLEEATEARVVHELPGTVGRYSFSHALIRETLYEELSATRRVRLHSRIGEALEELHGDDVDSHLSELAYHFLRAALGGDVEKAADYSLRAGWHAVDQLAFEEAAGHFERGLEALELVDEGAPEQRCELLLGLGAAQSKAGDFAESKESFQAAAELARQLGEADKLARAALGFREGLGGIGYAAATDPEGVKLFEESLAGMSEEDSPLRVRVLSRLATELYYTPTVERRDALSREAVAMAERLGDPESRLFALYSRLWALLGPDTVEERLEGSAEVLRLAAEVGDAEMVFRGHWTRLTALIDRGDFDALDAELEACDRLAEELRQPLYQSYAMAFHTARALIRGQLDEAERLAEEALGQAGGHEGIFQIVSAQLAGVYWSRGRMGELEDATKEFVEGYPDLLAWRAALAMIYTEQRRQPEAREQLEMLAQDDFGVIPRDGHWTLCLGLCIWTAELLGDAGRAAQLYELLLPHRDQTVVAAGGTVCIGPAPLFLGAAAATAGRFEDAAEHFELAIKRCEQMDARPFLARALRDYAAMLRKRGDSGDRERASDLAHRSLELARELGMEGVAEQAAVLVGELGSAQPSGSAAG